MNIITHLSPVEKHDVLYADISFWQKFRNEEKTKNIDLHIGPVIDFSKIDKSKTNVMYSCENPNIWINHADMQKRCEAEFDHIFSYDFQCTAGRSYKKCNMTSNFRELHKSVGINDINTIKKDIDVYLTTTPDPDKTYNRITHFHKALKKYKYEVVARDIPGKNFSHKEKININARSKISVVWQTQYWSEKSKSYADQNIPWIKVLKMENGICETPQPKLRIYEAAACKSLILCYKDKFSEMDYPFSNPAEDTFIKDVDFIYFEDNGKDLDEKINYILNNYSEFDAMRESAYKKVMKYHDIDYFYKNCILPLTLTEKY